MRLNEQQNPEPRAGHASATDAQVDLAQPRVRSSPEPLSGQGEQGMCMGGAECDYSDAVGRCTSSLLSVIVFILFNAFKLRPGTIVFGSVAIITHCPSNSCGARLARKAGLR